MSRKDKKDKKKRKEGKEKNNLIMMQRFTHLLWGTLRENRVVSMLPRVNSPHLSKEKTKNRNGKRQTIRINIFSAEEDKKEEEYIPRIT